jgi:hypothetical protein
VYNVIIRCTETFDRPVCYMVTFTFTFFKVISSWSFIVVQCINVRVLMSIVGGSLRGSMSMMSLLWNESSVRMVNWVMQNSWPNKT